MAWLTCCTDASSSDSGSSSESDSSSDYSSEDSDAEFVTPSVDQAILRTIAKIQAKDPSIYEKGSNVYDDFEKSAQSGQPSGHSDKKKQEHKPMRMKDMQRLQLLGQLQQEQHEQPTPAQEEAALKAEMRAAFHQDNISNHSDSGEDDGLLQVRQTLQPNEDNDEEMKSLIDSTLSKDDAFLRDFILKRGWVDKTKDALPTHEQIVGQDKEDVFEGPTGANALGPGFKPLQQDDDEADAEFENRAEAFENRYNFRFEESCVIFR